MNLITQTTTQELVFLENLSWGIIAFAFITFFLLHIQTAPYGRYAQNASKWWGPGISTKFAWMVQEMPSFLWPLYFLILMPPKSLYAVLILGCFLLHYFQRVFIFSTRIRSKSSTKLLPFIMAFIFCFLNGYLQSAYFSKYFNFVPNFSSISLFIGGLIVFLAGMAINIHSDTILRKLRKTPECAHQIPLGGFFKYVSAANFFGEIVEWVGFAIMSNFSLPAVAFAFSTFANIGPRGKQHHQNYLEKFENYPKNRKAVIPYIW